MRPPTHRPHRFVRPIFLGLALATFCCELAAGSPLWAAVPPEPPEPRQVLYLPFVSGGRRDFTTAGAKTPHEDNPVNSQAPAVYLPSLTTGTIDVAAVDAAAMAATARSYYFFAGHRLAMAETGQPLRYLHTDHLGSTVLETWADDGRSAADQRYFAFGRQRDSDPVATDRRFTGQQVDKTGLFYVNARYYDPTIGQFISPDSLVPELTALLDYNRYLYARGNPLTYRDPSGHRVSVLYRPQAGTVDVTATIGVYDLHGTASDAEMATLLAEWEREIESDWNGLTYRDEGIVTVTVDVTVKHVDGPTACRGLDNCIAAVWPDPTNGIVDLSGSPCSDRSCVAGDQLAHISAVLGLPYLADRAHEGAWITDDPWIAAHEFGHLAGLGDDYQSTGPNSSRVDPVHAGHMMAEYGGQTAQHEIDAIVDRSLPFFSAKYPLIAFWRDADSW